MTGVFWFVLGGVIYRGPKKESLKGFRNPDAVVEELRTFGVVFIAAGVQALYCAFYPV